MDSRGQAARTCRCVLLPQHASTALCNASLDCVRYCTPGGTCWFAMIRDTAAQPPASTSTSAGDRSLVSCRRGRCDWVYISGRHWHGIICCTDDVAARGCAKPCCNSPLHVTGNWSYTSTPACFCCGRGMYTSLQHPHETVS